MVVGLYTGRVMLQTLGVDNYGINSVVGGIVAMSSLITGTMSQAISRLIYLAEEIIGINTELIFQKKEWWQQIAKHQILR